MSQYYGQVIARQGKRANVWLPASQEIVLCHARRQQLQVVCGDWVDISIISGLEGVVEKCHPRKNVFSRRDEVRTKTIAANVDQVFGVLAWDPLPSESLLMRWILVAHVQKVNFVLIVNKRDLAQHLPEHPLWEWIPRYRNLGITVIEVSAQDSEIEAIREPLQHKTTVLIGQSGAGKSSIINALIPGLNLSTRELSEAMGSGRHTTTTTQLYWLDEARQTAVMDSPGMQTFGVKGLSQQEILASCPDFAPYLGKCRFRNCQHDREPDCAFTEAISAGKITEERWDIIQEIIAEAEGAVIAG
ncbi:MAG: ribosome small subunit-dependent GTPase A [Pseudomonadota bacterium]